MASPRLVFAPRARVGTQLPVAGDDAPMRRPWALWLSGAYAVLGLSGVALSYALGASPFTRAPWLDTRGAEALVASLALGVASGVLIVMATRRVERRAAWARALSDKLRPFVRGESDVVLFAIALAGGVCEEVFFRGFLSQSVGIAASCVAFGLLHQVRGSGRWGWAFSATLLGAWMAVLFALTGNLAGPIAAHVLVNAMNLRHLRDRGAASKARKLGGLLRTRA